MKQLIFLSIVLFTSISMHGRVSAIINPRQSFNDTITTAPAGSVIKDGELVAAKGYKIKYSADGVGTIYRVSDGKVMFSAVCGEPCPGGGSCLCSNAARLKCNCGCCGSTWDRPAVRVISVGEIASDGKTTWKVLVIPKTKINTSSN